MNWLSFIPMAKTIPKLTSGSTLTVNSFSNLEVKLFVSLPETPRFITSSYLLKLEATAFSLKRLFKRVTHPPPVSQAPQTMLSPNTNICIDYYRVYYKSLTIIEELSLSLQIYPLLFFAAYNFF